VVNVNRLEIVFTNALKLIDATEEPQGHARLTVRFDGFAITTQGDVMFTLPVDHTVQMQVAYKDAAGNPATIDGDVEWTSSDDAVATVTVDTSDSTIVRVVPVGPLGQVQVTASADADLGSGVRKLKTLADIEIVGGEAVTGTISPLGEIEPKE
jgi:hypothetical protein